MEKSESAMGDFFKMNDKKSIHLTEFSAIRQADKHNKQHARIYKLQDMICKTRLSIF